MNLTIEEIEAVCSPELINARNDSEIAAAVNANRQSKIVSTPIGIGTILAVMAPDGGLFLDALQGIGAGTGAVASNVRWTLKMIEQATFDVGHPVTRAQLAQFAAGTPEMAAGINALLAVAERPDPVSVNDVSNLLNGG